MRETTLSEKAMIGFSVALSVLAVSLFLWSWFKGQRPSADEFRTTVDLSPVNVVGLSSEADKLLSGLKNNSGIPIPEPVSKEGRTDPFAAL